MLGNVQLIESIIVDCNNAVGAALQGQYILFCRLMYEIVRKLGNLKKGVTNDMQNRDEIIATLKADLEKYGEHFVDMPVKELIENEQHD